jgi:leucyl aminopeptidase
MSGQTIEILNTDAEGRLILCDALTYAERFKPRGRGRHRHADRRLRDRAGRGAQRPVRHDDALAAALLAAGEQALDPCWRMPLDDEYAEG